MMRHMSLGLKKALLTGCCSLGFGLGVFGQKAPMQEQTRSQTEKRSVEDIVTETPLGDVIGTMEQSVVEQNAVATFPSDETYRQRVDYIAENNVFVERETVEKAVALVTDYIMNRPDETPLAKELSGFTAAELENVYHGTYVGPILGQSISAKGFDVEFEIVDALDAKKQWVAAHAGNTPYAYNIKMLHELMPPLKRFNEQEKADIGLIIPDGGGVQAYAIRHNKWNDKDPKFGSVLLLGDLLSMLDVPEIKSVQYHELGHFKYDLMGGNRQRQRFLSCVLGQLGYSKQDIKAMKPIEEEVFADLYAVRQMVGEYGAEASAHMSDAFVKITASQLVVYDGAQEVKPHKIKEFAANLEDKEAVESAFRASVAGLLQKQQLQTQDNNTHPTLPMRLDMVERAAAYYMKTNRCSCD